MKGARYVIVGPRCVADKMAGSSAKKVAMEAAHKASKEAIKQGLSKIEASKVAHEAIMMAL